MIRSGLLLLLLAAGLQLFAAGLPTAGDKVTFQFRPTDSRITLIDTEQRTVTETMESDGETETTVTVTLEKTKTQIVKTARGYTVTTITLSLRRGVNGVEEEPDGFDKAFMAVPLTVEVDKNGRPIAFKGFDTLREKALELIDDEDERAYYERVMTEERMELLAKGEWAATNGALLGQTRKPGDSWQSKIKWFLFSPSLVPVTTDYSFVRMYNVAGHPCAMLKNVMKPDLKTAARDLERMFTELELLPEGLEAKYSVQSYNEEYTQYIDPATFLTWKATESSTKQFTVTLEGVDVVTTETIESTTTTEVDDGRRDT
ncbi:MAG: hypothetical protein ACYDCO_22210 [Armatimonadota bacterium]